MNKFVKLLMVATIGSICANAAPLVPYELNDNPVTAHPGALFASLKLSSLNNIFQLMAPLLANEILQKTFPVDIHKNITSSIALNLDSVSLTPSSDFIHDLAWKAAPAVDTIEFTFSNFDLNGTMVGNMTGLPQKVTLQSFALCNITIALEVATPQTAAQDGVHFQIQGKPSLSIGDVELKVKQFIPQIAINKLMPTVVSSINYALGLAEGYIEGRVWGLNQNLAGGDSLIVSLGDSLPSLNLTAPMAPSLDQSTDLINVWLDGRFVDKTTGKSTVQINDVAPVRTDLELPQYEQIFIHQSMLDSSVFELYKMDKTIAASQSLQAQLSQIFYELGQYYGPDMKMDLEVSFDQQEGDLIKFDTTEGIEIGNIPAGGLKTELTILCTNSTEASPVFEKAVSMTMDIHVDIKAQFNNFVITGAINNVGVANTEVTYAIATLDYHNFDVLFTSVVNAMADDFNLVHSQGLNLVEKYPTLGFISGMARNSIVSPLIQEEFLYMGFKWITDFGEARDLVKEFVN